MEPVVNRAAHTDHMGRRTITVVHRDRVSEPQHLLDSLAQISIRVQSNLRALGARINHPRVLLVLAAFLVLSLVFTIHNYNQLAAEIDARLQNSTLDDSIGIFTAPVRISVGDRVLPGDLTDSLRAAGYQQRTESIGEEVASFSVAGNKIEVFPGAGSSPAQVAPVRITLDKRGRVGSLISIVTGQRMLSVSVEGELLATVRGKDRRKTKPVQFSDIPENLRNAILAVEDRRFFSHNGIDFRGVIRALKEDIDQGEVVQGGSTITQQLIKNTFLTPDRTFKRKLKEAAMSLILESRLSKEEIFSLYCSDVYLGQSGPFAINGFGQAAQVYFDKDLSGLTLGESAFLAGLIRAPNRYSAHRDKSRVLERRNGVLDAMVETEAITPEEASLAKGEPLNVKKHETEDDYGTSYFIDYVQRFVDERYGQNGVTGRQRITTTMDPRLQRAAFRAVKQETEKLDRVFSRPSRGSSTSKVGGGAQNEPQRVQGALVALNSHTGEVLAMVGGRSYDESQLNRATDAKRQPGSAFKPFVYAAALSSRAYTAASMISDTPKTFKYDENGGKEEYRPSDYRGSFLNRDVTVREALTRSLNVPAVEIAMKVGLGSVADLAEKSGLQRPRAYPSMALGTSEVTPLELAGAYTAFANGGIALRPTPVASLSAIGEPEHDERVSATSTHVVSPQVAYLMTNLLQSVVDQGTAARLRGMGLGGAIAGKTGTTTDGWFVGYTPSIVCVVWVGFDDNRDLRMKASDAALPMWVDFVKSALELRPELAGGSFVNPGGLVSVEIDPATGCRASPESAQRRLELFLAGTQPLSSCFSEMATDELLTSDLEEPAEDDSSALKSAQPAEREDMVTVEVCTLSGLLSAANCPRKEKKAFEIGKEPLETCRLEKHEPESHSRAPFVENERDSLQLLKIARLQNLLRLPSRISWRTE